MKKLSIKLDEIVYNVSEKLLRKINKSGNSYLTKTLINLNRHQKRKLIADQLAVESAIVREDSMVILAEFDGAEGTMNTDGDYPL